MDTFEELEINCYLGFFWSKVILSGWTANKLRNIIDSVSSQDFLYKKMG